MIIALRKENERLLSFPPGSDSQLITFFFFQNTSMGQRRSTGTSN